VPILELQIVQSTQDPTLVTFRPLNRAVTGVRRELTAAGFKPGERVVVLDKDAYELLVNHSSRLRTDLPPAEGV
jgi:hypothetical protein